MAKEKVLFAVDILPVGQAPSRRMIALYPLEAEAAIHRVLRLDWNTLAPAIRASAAGAAVRVEAQEARAGIPVEKALKLPKYASWPGCEANLPFVLRRYCALWGRGT